MSIFNDDFYPTPEETAHLICSKVDIQNKVVLEPSMGSGSLVDVIRQYFPKQVIGCENSKELLKISADKVDRVLGEDFLSISKEEVSHINCIIANPPFQNANEHILKMWEVAPDGCTIVAILNKETLENTYSKRRTILKDVISKNGYSEFLGQPFKDAERKTNVEVSLIVLFKPISDESNYDFYFDMNEEEEEVQSNGIMQRNEVKNIVNRYVDALKTFNSVVNAQAEMNSLIEPLLSSEHGIYFKAVDKKGYNITFESFKSELQKSAWVTVFNKLGAKKYMTSSLQAFLNRFVEQQKTVPFTMKNIYKMVEMVIGTHGERMNKVIIEVFDWLTEHHSENKYIKEGWKTNSEYIVNKKFIAPYCGVGMGFNGYPDVKYYQQGNRMDDLMKAMCYITGTKYNERDTFEMFFKSESVKAEKVDPDIVRDPQFKYLQYKVKYKTNNGTQIDVNDLFQFEDDENYDYKLDNYYNKTVVRYKLFGKWYNWGFFKVKVFKKGTLHVEFLDEDVWVKFNQTAAKAKGFQLASKFRGNYRTKGEGLEVY